MIHASCRRVGADKEIARAVYSETMQQLEDGWVKGPFTEEYINDKYQQCWIPSNALERARDKRFEQLMTSVSS